MTARLDLATIKKYPRTSNYHVDVGLPYLASHVLHYIETYALDMNPPFQRSHVWNDAQRVAYIEHVLAGGMSGRDIYVNHSSWHILGKDVPSVLVDGKQRLDALLKFVGGELAVFGGYHYNEIDNLRGHVSSIRWHVNELPTMDEVIEWYLAINARGTPHTYEELDLARSCMGVAYNPTPEEVQSHAGLDRPIFVEMLRKREEATAARHVREAEEKARREATEAAKEAARVARRRELAAARRAAKAVGK
jgi:hypothetical protein